MGPGRQPSQAQPMPIRSLQFGQSRSAMGRVPPQERVPKQPSERRLSVGYLPLSTTPNPRLRGLCRRGPVSNDRSPADFTRSGPVFCSRWSGRREDPVAPGLACAGATPGTGAPGRRTIDQRHLFEFARSHEALVKVSDDRVESGCRDRGHVKRPANFETAAGNPASAAGRPRVFGVGCHPDQEVAGHLSFDLIELASDGFDHGFDTGTG